MQMAAWWGTRAKVSARLQLEVAAMRDTFRDTFRLVVARGDRLYWAGEVDLNLAGIPQRRHTLHIVYPTSYPSRAAEAYVRDPEIVSRKHQFEDGQLCLFNPRDGKRYGWNPGRSTAVTVAGWAVQWLYAYYTWKATGNWPGLEERIQNNGRPRP